MVTKTGRSIVAEEERRFAQALERTPRILIVEDEGAVQTILRTMLLMHRLPCAIAGSLAEARSLREQGCFDILIVDVNLPDGTGLSLIEEMSCDEPVVVVMTGSDDIQIAIQAIRDGAIDFITKPFTIEGFLDRLEQALARWRSREVEKGQSRALETLVRMKSDELAERSLQMEAVYDMTVEALGAALRLKDHETADHCARVSKNSVSLGRSFELSDFELRNLKWGAYLHDVGKIGIPEQILLKRGPLTAEERAIMERHPLMGDAIVRNIEFLRFASDVVLCHHERYDGSGYPGGLRGEEIPLNARIFSVLDALDAMTSDRPYRVALAFDTAEEELRRGAGSMFDPEIIEAFLEVPDTTWLIQPGPAKC